MRFAARRTTLAALEVAVLLALAARAAAQTPDSLTSHGADPLGRETPRGTIVAFTEAVRRGDFVVAQACMQLTPLQRPSAETLARDLTGLLDRYYTQPVTDLSDLPGGTPDDGLPLDRERVRLSLPDTTFELGLVRVPDTDGHPIWLISSESLAQVPAFRGVRTGTWIERVMPRSLVGRSVLGLSLAHWAVFVASIAAPLLLLTLLGSLLARLARRSVRDPVRRALLEAWYGGLIWPLVLALTLIIQLLLMRVLGFPLTFRITWARLGLSVLVFSVTWLVWRLMSLGFQAARLAALRRAQSGTQSLLLLGERVAKVVVLLVAIFAILTIVGVETTAALAGLGIGGVAVALGAQRTVENLLGGISLLTDRAIAVGDYCRVADREGWIEDVTLRSVRLRTLEQTLLSVPAGVVAQAGVENYATRAKILVRCTLRLRYGTTAPQLRKVLAATRGLLASHPRVETESARIRLVDFGQQAIELELFAYLLTADWPEFLAMREDLLLQVAGILESSGSAFAQPTQFLYLAGDGPGGHPAPQPEG